MSTTTDQWNEIKVLVESLELDVQKNAGGNASAGVRARRGLRLLKTRAAEMIRESVSVDKDKSKKA